MIRIVLLASLMNLFFVIAQAQKPGANSSKKSKGSKLGIGIKAGLNFANVSNASSINSSNQAGFHAGLFFGASGKSLLGFRTELMYSQQGYGYSSDSTKGSVKLGYIMLAELIGINITRYLQIQVGPQISYLLNANAGGNGQSTGNQTADKVISFYNRLDYGFGAGLEIHPVGGLVIGARYTISLSNLYKQPSSTDSSGNPSFVTSGSSINFKNNAVQLFIGYRF